MIPLGMAAIGAVNIIQKTIGRDDVRRHLAELGFVAGEEVRVVNALGGNLILSIKNSRIALDQTMAMRIMV
ncbi:MAG: FeoA family protein [Clostridia bacterium]